MSTISQMDTPLYRAITPIPFSRDQIVWIEENPSTDRLSMGGAACRWPTGSSEDPPEPGRLKPQVKLPQNEVPETS